MSDPVSIGLDFGTNSVRAAVVRTSTGEALGTAVFNFPRGDMGVVIDPKDPHLARQHPADHLAGIEAVVPAALKAAGPGAAARVCGIGVDTTGSTPLPVDAAGKALALKPEFADSPDAMAWLWKDHTAIAEAGEITQGAQTAHPEYLAKCGGSYSPEWYWSKLLRCSRVAPDVFRAAATWVEMADWIPAVLTGTTAPDQIRRCICAAGHKAMFHPAWGGYPDPAFLAAFDNGALSGVRSTLPDSAVNISHRIGGLTADWAGRLGLRPGIPVAAGALDAHMGAVGSGVRPGVMVKVIGTSSCDLAVSPLSADLADIPGVCGIVPESVLPGSHGIEAGQAAVGDIFNWYVHKMKPGGGMDHEALTREAEALRPGESGLLALDWNNGNRNVLADPRLSGLILGLSLHTSPCEVFRALVEATAFGARMIRDRMAGYGVEIGRMICCGGISVKSPFLMQVYADALNCPMAVAASEQACALGAAMAGAVVGGVHPDFESAADAMTGVRDRVYTPAPDRAEAYDRLFGIYRRVHDGFGAPGSADLFDVMKDLIAIREACRTGG